MKAIITITTKLIPFLGIIFFPLFVFAENVPHEVGGISLGSHIDDYPNAIRSNFLKEVVVNDRPGFRKGVISYGTCKYQGEVLRIKLKYDDKSKAFYTSLLTRYKEKYGPPDSWNGDSFGLIHLWKWRFTDKDNNRITLRLHYNAKDPDDTIGNMVKLSYPDRIQEERICFNQMYDAAKKKTSDWSYLIPR